MDDSDNINIDYCLPYCKREECEKTWVSVESPTEYPNIVCACFYAPCVNCDKKQQDNRTFTNSNLVIELFKIPSPWLLIINTVDI